MLAYTRMCMVYVCVCSMKSRQLYRVCVCVCVWCPTWRRWRRRRRLGAAAIAQRRQRQTEMFTCRDACVCVYPRTSDASAIVLHAHVADAANFLPPLSPCFQFACAVRFSPPHTQNIYAKPVRASRWAHTHTHNFVTRTHTQIHTHHHTYTAHTQPSKCQFKTSTRRQKANQNLPPPTNHPACTQIYLGTAPCGADSDADSNNAICISPFALSSTFVVGVVNVPDSISLRSHREHILWSIIYMVHTEWNETGFAGRGEDVRRARVEYVCRPIRHEHTFVVVEEIAWVSP